MVGGAAKQERLALGPATNLASRLQAIAEPGRVYIDSATYGRVRRDFVTQAKAPIYLKGFEEAVKHYIVLAKRSQPTTQFTNTHIHGLEMPLIGRDEDLALIGHLCDRAIQDQQFYTMTIVGDVGIGKSRLLQETVHLTEGTFLPIVMAAQYESRSRPYNLLRDMLITQCNITHDMPPELIRQQITAYISELWQDDDAAQAAGAIGHLAGFDFEPPEGQALDWVGRWFAGVAQTTPILIAVDNLQWADKQSVMLLEYLTQALSATATVLVVAGRPEYRTVHARYMHEQPNHRRIPLNRLHSEATRILVEAVLQSVQHVPHTLPDLISERAEGNPLFVQEFLSMLFEQNVIQADDQRHLKFNVVMLDAALNTLPTGLIGILQARLDDLSPEVRHIAQIAAVAGHIFWSGAIATVADTPNTQRYLNTLVLRGIIVEQPFSEFDDQLEYTFRHTLYRNVAYEMLPRRQRENYHAQIANWLVQRIAGKNKYYPLLANHFLHGGVYGAALYSYLEAVYDRIEIDHLAEALTLIDQSLAIANKVPRQEALPIVSKLWTLRGQVLVDLGRYDEASAASQSALMLLKEVPAEQLIDVRIRAQRMLGLAYLSQGRYNDAYDALTQAYNRLPYNATSQISAVLRSFGVLLLYQGRLQDSLAYQKRAFNQAQATEDNRLIVDSLAQLGLIDIELGNLSDALDCFDQTLKTNREHGYIAHEARDLRSLGVIHMVLMQPQQAFIHFSQASELHQETGQHDVLLQAYRALALLHMGRLTEGKALLLDAVTQGSSDVYVQQHLQLNYINGLVVLEDYVKCREQALAFAEQTRTTNHLLHARALRWLGLSMYKLGDLHAVATLHKALTAEETYGGADVWLCHYWIAKSSDDPREQRQHFGAAARYMQALLDDLAHRVELHDALQAHPIVQEIVSDTAVDALK